MTLYHPMFMKWCGGYYPLTGEDFQKQYCHNDFQSSKKNPPGHFVIVTGARGFTWYLSGNSYLYVSYPEKTINILTNAVTLKGNNIPNSVLSVMVRRNMLAMDGGNI